MEETKFRVPATHLTKLLAMHPGHAEVIEAFIRVGRKMQQDAEAFTGVRPPPALVAYSLILPVIATYCIKAEWSLEQFLARVRHDVGHNGGLEAIMAGINTPDTPNGPDN